MQVLGYREKTVGLFLFQSSKNKHKKEKQHLYCGLKDLHGKVCVQLEQSRVLVFVKGAGHLK